VYGRIFTELHRKSLDKTLRSRYAFFLGSFLTLKWLLVMGIVREVPVVRVGRLYYRAPQKDGETRIPTEHFGLPNGYGVRLSVGREGRINVSLFRPDVESRGHRLFNDWGTIIGRLPETYKRPPTRKLLPPDVETLISQLVQLPSPYPNVDVFRGRHNIKTNWVAIKPWQEDVWCTPEDVGGQGARVVEWSVPKPAVSVAVRPVRRGPKPSGFNAG
jgi:hypothetical protein